MVADNYILSGNQLLIAYEKMLLLRRFEEKCGQLYGMGLIGGFCHLYIGQEAVAVAADMAKSSDDCIVTSYRDHAHAILSGLDPKNVMAELTGRASGCSRGKGGSMHMFNPDGQFFGGHGIVGAQVPIGTGIAFAQQYRNNEAVCITFLGDGAVNQGQTFEAWNIAALWKLPAIYIIENNEYSMGTSVKRSTAMTDLYKKGLSVGIEGNVVDGMDVRKVFAAVSKAIEFVKSGNGPIILEMKTYRYRGHSMSDPAKYRSKEEVEYYKDHDPISLLKDVILKNKYINEVDLKNLEKRVMNVVREAEHFAKDDHLPNPNQLYTDVYIESKE